MSALAISNIVLWLVVICLVLVLLALTRQLGVLHETPPGVVPSSERRARRSLELVGAERQVRGHSDRQQCRQADDSAASGDGVDKPRAEAGQRQEHLCEWR